MKSVSVIVVEDNDALREVTVLFLQSRGHQVRGAPDGDTLDELLAESAAEVVVLDINLPGEDGLSICRRLRAGSPRLGIILLTARTAPHQRVEGYDDGADIYLGKPTSNEELAAAVQSLARRASAVVDLGSTLTGVQAPLVVDASALRVEGPVSAQSLTDAELKIVRGLSLGANRQLEYWQLLELLGLNDDDEGKAALEVRITRLRKKLLAAGAPDPAIKALRRFGYQLVTSVSLV